MYYDKNDYTELCSNGQNFLTETDKKYLLPFMNQKYGVVELYLVNNKKVMIHSLGFPIRYGIYYGSKICVGGIHGNSIDLNPKFIWSNNEWFLSTHGHIFFPEIELNLKIEINKE